MFPCSIFRVTRSLWTVATCILRSWRWNVRWLQWGQQTAFSLPHSYLIWREKLALCLYLLPHSQVYKSANTSYSEGFLTLCTTSERYIFIMIIFQDNSYVLSLLIRVYFSFVSLVLEYKQVLVYLMLIPKLNYMNIA